MSVFHGKLEIMVQIEKMRDSLKVVQTRLLQANRSTAVILKGDSRSRSRPKRTWIEAIKKDLAFASVREEMALNRSEWKKKIHTADPLIGIKALLLLLLYP